LPDATNLLVAGALSVGLLLLLLPPDLALGLTRENGPVENLSALVAAVGAMVAGLKLVRSRGGIWAAITLMLVWAIVGQKWRSPSPAQTVPGTKDHAGPGNCS
jgi:hypothetical protein